MSQWITRVYEAVDRKDIERYVQFFTEDCSFRFGNNPAVQGKNGIRQALQQFFPAIKGLKHDNVATWSPSGFEMVEAWVTYTRHDNSTVRVPAVTIYRMQGNLAKDCRIFVDLAPLWATQG